MHCRRQNASRFKKFWKIALIYLWNWLLLVGFKMTEFQCGLANNECHVKTIINASTYTFNWTVENFSKFELGTEKKSPTFHPRPNQEFYATLEIDKDLGGCLYFHHISQTSIEVKHNVSIENTAGEVVLKYDKFFTYDTNGSYCDLLPRCIPEMKKARGENVLIFKCVMEFCGEDKRDTYCYKPHSKPASPLADLSALSKDLQSMFNTSMDADISLKVGDSIVRVHKSLVCARSPVFARMFETPMDEREENVIHITDLELPVLRDLVSYLYTGMLDKPDFESVYSLFYAADKYDVSSLRKMCVHVLLSKLDVENACRVLAMADQHSDVEFKKSVMDFIKFYFNEVRKTESWKELVDNAPRLAMEVVTLWV